jgi:hypothetical protein
MPFLQKHSDGCRFLCCLKFKEIKCRVLVVKEVLTRALSLYWGTFREDNFKIRRQKAMYKYLLFVLFLLTGSILNAQPSPVTIVLPQDGSTAVTSPVNFFWSKSPLALAYTIQISTDNLFGSTVVNQSISDTTYSTSILQMSTKYYWRVRAENTDGASSWANSMFTTKLNIPSLSNPATGAIDINLKPTLSWASELSSAKYTLQLSLQSDFEIIAQSIDITSTTVILDSLNRSTTYYWRVRAYINGDTTAYSSPRNFLTIPFVPVVPNLLFPLNASTNIPVNAVLRWSNVQNATSYNLQVSMSPIFTTLLKDSSFTDTLYRPRPLFNSNTQYFWRVSSTNGAGTSNYSGTYRYTTGTDTNKARISFSNINLGTVNAGTIQDAVVSITNTGTNDLIISSLSNRPTNWTAVNTGLTNIDIRALTVYGTNLFAGTDGGGVFLSTNNGISWSTVNTGLTNTYVGALTVSGTNLFAGTQGGVFLSTDNGTSWNQVNTGLTYSSVRALAVSGTNLFAGGDAGVFLSTNNGTSWTVVNTGLTDSTVRALEVSGTNLFVGTWGGVFFSTNNGTSWSTINAGLTDNALFVYAFAVTGVNLFAGTWGGVFLSTNNGSSWTAVNTEHVWSLAVSGTNLFAGTWNGIFESICPLPSISTSIISPGASTNAYIHISSIPVGGMNGKIIVVSNAPSSPDTITLIGYGVLTDVKENAEIPKGYALSQNYPNPFNPSTTISFSLPSKSFVSLKVFDLIGRDVATIVSEEMSAGSYSKQWNAVNMSSGIYFYRLQVGSFTETKKLVLLR